jgi:undecaprenyl diphosphate synthase
MFKDLEGFLEPGSEEERLAREIDPKRIPQHVAVIMDGNGRWAKSRSLARIEGHRAGIRSVREIVETSARVGVKVLTLFAFSSENWKRPEREVSTLFRLMVDFLRREDKVLMKNDFQLRVIGRRDGLPEKARRELDRVETLTRDNKKMVLCIALNYGGRAEIVDAVKSLLADAAASPAPAAGGAPAAATVVDEDAISRRLYTAGLPDPDLLIRTSGEYRISNFLLWQIAYAEIWITPAFWPEFRKRHFLEAIVDYQKRERRFGDVRPPS